MTPFPVTSANDSVSYISIYIVLYPRQLKLLNAI